MSAHLVIVGGAPGTGKTTLARAIARELHAVLLAKDEIKEALADTLGAGDRTRSRELGIATYEVMYRLAARALGDGATIVLESHFYREHATEPLRAIAAGAGALVVICRAEEKVRRARYAARTDRHPVHLDAEILAKEWPTDDAAYELDLGVPRLVVDTNDGYAPSLADVIAFARSAARHPLH